MTKKDSNNYGIASLVLGIVSIVFCWIPFLGLIAGTLGIVFYAQQRKIHSNDITIGGLITSIIGLVFSVFWTIFWTAVIVSI